MQQTLELRKKFAFLPSLHLDGTTFLELIETYIDSFNNGESFEKVCFEGEDCLQRIRCVDRFRDQLQNLEQENSIGSYEEVNERQS